MARPLKRPSNAEAREYCERWNLPSWQGADGFASPDIAEYAARYRDLDADKGARDLKWEVQRRTDDYRAAHAMWEAGGLRDEFDYLPDPRLQASDLPERFSYPNQRKVGGANADRFAMSKTDLIRMLSLPPEEQEAFGRRWADAQAEDYERRGLSAVTLVINPDEGLTAHMDRAEIAIKWAQEAVRAEAPSKKTTAYPHLLLMVLDGYALGVSPAHIGKFIPRAGSQGNTRPVTDDTASAANRLRKEALSLLDRL